MTGHFDQSSGISRYVAVVLLVLLGAAAYYGAWEFITHANGSTYLIPLELLGAPSHNQSILARTFLFTTVGLFSTFTLIATVVKHRNYPWMLQVQGCVLVVWLGIELLLDPALYHPILFFFMIPAGCVLILIGARTGRAEQLDQ